MARKSDPAVTVQDHQHLIPGVAKHFLPKVYGPEGMPWGTKLTELEEPAIQIGRAISRSMINQALVPQAEQVPEAAEACGVCGAAVQCGPPPEPRALTTTVGLVQGNEPKRYGPKYRPAFSPSGPEFGDGPRLLQPSRPADDCLRWRAEHVVC